MLTRLRTGLGNAAHGASTRADALLHETTLRLAVTGLSRAGKTVFVTSLLANLLAMSRDPDRLPALARHLRGGERDPSAAASRLRAVRLVAPGSEETPPFDLARHLASLTMPTPEWPARTDDLSETAIELVLDREGALRKLRGNHRLRIELLDYPGEWLLDLSLLDQSFAAWARETLARLRQGARAVAFAPFLAQISTAGPGDPPDNAHLRRLHALYRDGLHAAQAEGLRLLQPGRFLCPGPRADAPFMWFFPLDGAPDHPRRGTVAALLQERFEAYKADMRVRFFESHFARFNRQVLLVDVLGALHVGREAFQDTQAALALIARSLSYRQERSLIWPRQGTIERVAFAATKADHVPAGQRTNLCHLLRDLVEDARAPLGKHPVSFHAVASVLSTEDAIVEIDGLTRDVVRGTPVGVGTAKLFDPGHVPSGRPPDGFWDRPRFVLPVFEPPRDKAMGPAGIPNRGLDEVLLALLEDQL